MVARHQAGDPTAFTDLYQRYFRRLCVDHLREQSRVTAQSDPDVGIHDDVNQAIDARADGHPPFPWRHRV